jgi:hypothetical protein
MNPKSSSPRRLDEAQIAALLEQVGARKQPPPEAMASARESVRAAWREQVQAHRDRQRGRWRGWAAAAGVLLALGFAFNVSQQGADPGAGGVELAQRVNSVEVYSTATGQWRDAPERMALEPGDRLRSGPRGFAVINLPDGVTLRMDAASEFALFGDDHVHLDSGAVYVDASGAGTLRVDTALGSARDIGTRYEVRLLDADRWQVSVRDGTVVLSDDVRGEVQARAGERLIVADNRLHREAVGPADASWDWTHGALRPMAIEGRMLSAYLDWWSRESGVTVEYAKPISRSIAGQTRLHGDLSGLSLDGGFDAVIAGAGFRVVDRDEERVIVTN